MKKLILPILAAICCFATFKAEAQIDLTINPIGALFGDFNIGADFGISNNFSVEAQVGFGSGKIGGADWKNIPVNAVAKYYFNPKNGADRFYVDAFLRFVNRSFDYNDSSLGLSNYKATRFGVGFGLGYKVVANKGFVFDIGLGFGRALYTKNRFESGGTEQEANWGNGIFLGKLGVGYRFGGHKD